MLVITRKTDESIVIGDNIEITVLEVGKDRIRIGINAPKEVRILRKEILITENNNKEASEKLPDNVMKLLLNNDERGN